MGKASKVKSELVSTRDLNDVIQVLKDVADMRYFSLSTQKDHFLRFNESFVDFFRLIAFSSVRHPLVSNDYAGTAYLVFTTEQGFVGDLNTKVATRAVQEKEKNPNALFITIGRKGVAKMEQLGHKSVKTFEDIDDKDRYQLALSVKDYLIEEIMSGRIGKVSVIYPWPKELGVVKPRMIRLLPCEHVLRKQAQLMETFKHVIEESDPVEMIGYMASIWVTSRLFEIFYDTALAAAAAQTQQLDSSSQKMKKEMMAVRLKYRKARRSDIDKSLREVFSAKMMADRKK
jgi:ATP synthase F1 gamma subunit